VNTRNALIKAKEIAEVNLKAIQTPARADVEQLVDGYVPQHVIDVLTKLIALYPEEG